MNKSILVTMCVVSILIILLLINTVQSYSQPDNKTEIIVRFIPGIIELPETVTDDISISDILIHDSNVLHITSQLNITSIRRAFSDFILADTLAITPSGEQIRLMNLSNIYIFVTNNNSDAELLIESIRDLDCVLYAEPNMTNIKSDIIPCPFCLFRLPCNTCTYHSPLLYRSNANSHSTHIHFSAEVASCVGSRKPRATASTRCPATKFQKASLNEPGSHPMDYPITFLDQLEKIIDGSQTRDRYPLAQERIPAVLEMEESTEVAGQAKGPRGDPRSHSYDVTGKLLVGRSEDPWRVAQARYRGQPSNRLEVYGTPPETSLPELAHIPEESRQGYCLS